MQYTPFEVFVSYAHEDMHFMQELVSHLSLLRHQGLISVWHDNMIMAEMNREHEISEHLNSASIILLLISADFIASDYCYSIEMEHALERHRRGEARVIPIILRPVSWQSAPFAHIPALPRNGEPITSWRNRDEAFTDTVRGLRQVIESQKTSLTNLTSRLSSVDQRNRQRLLERVQMIWIEGFLEKSLHQEIFVSPRLQEQPDAVNNPWSLVLQETNLSSHALPAGTYIIEAYDKAGGNLLILGQPGAGKTILLLELTRNLVSRAEYDISSPVPVIFHLSSWSQKRQPLIDWLIEELVSKYDIPRKLSKDWIDNDQIIPLLDGLDEMPVGTRQRCVDAINSYHQSHALTPLVVCCRSDEYQSMKTRLSLRIAIMVQPYRIKEEWVKDGDDHAAAGRYNEALTAYNHALHLDKNDDLLYYQKGRILASLEDYDEAISAFDQAIRLSPRFASAYLSKGKVLQQLSRYEEALQAFLQARELGYVG
jgi:Flp pilus assembly protein TadD